MTIDMVKKAISQMKAGKALGPSGIVMEMIRATGDTGASMIGDLAAAIIHDGMVPSDWEQSFIVCLYKSKGDATGQGQLPWSHVDRAGHESPGEDCGQPYQTGGVSRRFPVWLPGRGTTDATFVVRLLQVKYLATNKRLYMAFIDLEKAFDQLPWKVIWWALRNLGGDEWIV